MLSNFQINPASAEDWLLAATETRDFTNTAPSSFSLGSDFDSSFIAIEIDVSNSKPHWSAGGYVHQEFNYPGLSVSTFTHFLKLNKPNLIEVNTNEDYQYELIYYPRNYFQIVEIKVWTYTGETINRSVNDFITALQDNAAIKIDISSLEKTINELKQKQSINYKYEFIQEDDHYPGFY